MTGSRRLSHAISEGTGISIVVEVADRAGAQAAETDGAQAVAVTGVAVGVREATTLPLLWLAGGRLREAREAGADAVVIAVGRDGFEDLVEEAHELGLEPVLQVGEEDEIERVLERVDPEILLLAGEGELERLLALLADVPAGKLAIAELAGAGRDQVAELERAGVDAVLVRGSVTSA